MARRLLTRRSHVYTFIPPSRVREELWRADVERMATLEEMWRLEAEFPRMRRQCARTHVLQWGRKTERVLRERLWVMLRSIEHDQRLMPVLRESRRWRRL